MKALRKNARKRLHREVVAYLATVAAFRELGAWQEVGR